MIEAQDFIEVSRRIGFSHYIGVPCSFLTPFINYVINDDELSYISAANEGDALASATGLAIGGKLSVVMMQNSGFGNAISPLTSLSYVFCVPTLLIVTHRGQPELTDEPQHELMGQIMTDLFELMHLPWATFPSSVEEIEPVLKQAYEKMKQTQRPYILVMQKGTVAKHALKKQGVPKVIRQAVNNSIAVSTEHKLPSRSQALKVIIEHTPVDNTIVIATTGYTGRELFALADRYNHLYMVGSMGCVAALGLGLALACPNRRVVVIDGDGAALMRMGNFATVGTYAQANFYHILLDNGVHDSTGGQATVSPNISFAAIAQACAYERIYQGHKLALIEQLFTDQATQGAAFLALKISSGTVAGLPRPNQSPKQVLHRLMKTLGTQF